MYGTSKKAVRDVAEQNKICILDIDEQGVKNLKKISDINPPRNSLLLYRPAQNTFHNKQLFIIINK